MKKAIKTITGISLILVLISGCATNKNLHIPASKGELDIVKTEIDSGSDVDLRDQAGQTALMYAAENGHLEVVKYLVSNGADVNAESKRFGIGTALIYAAASNRAEVMEYLIEHGADVDATSPKHKETALIWAAGKGHANAVKILLKHNADTEVKSKKGQTALDIAKELNRQEVIQLLTKATTNSSISSSAVSSIDYYGQAEEEINTQTYDKNLWARALVETEGDEQKRIAKYIELRANQLYSENVSSISNSNLYEQPAVGASLSQKGFAGLYHSNITGNAHRFLGSKTPNVQLAQDGNKITGTIGNSGAKIWGDVDGNTIEFYWNSKTGGGFGKWIFEPENNEAVGTWSSSWLGDGDWNLKRIE